MTRRLAPKTKRALNSIQRRLERYYGLERAPDVTRFAKPYAEGERETLLVRESDASIDWAEAEALIDAEDAAQRAQRPR